MPLSTGLGTDVHFTGEESGMLWEDYISEDQTAAEWKAVMSRGADERTQIKSMTILLATYDSLSNRELVDQGLA